MASSQGEDPQPKVAIVTGSSRGMYELTRLPQQLSWSKLHIPT